MSRALTLALLLALGFSATADARPPIRRAFFDAFPSAVGSRLDDLPSNATHCGVCHFDFDGGGQKNAFGVKVEAAINSGLFANTEAAILSLGNDDSDVDGFSNGIEITDTTNFSNTPTFPGLTAAELASLLNVNVNEVSGFVTPSGGSDVTPPTVNVLAPSGGQSWAAGETHPVTWTASDASGIAHVDVYLSGDGGATFKPIAKLEPDDGSFDFFVPNLPSATSVLRVAARDNAGNYGSGDSGTFTIVGAPGTVATTLRDFDMPGSQPFFGATLDDPDAVCATCHGNYNTAVEPWYNWKGSMMAQAMRDPIFLATLAVAEQDAPSVGDMCIRCHTPGGWLEGRSLDTLGNMMNAKDRQGVQCDFCHRMVDPIYTPGVSPASDVAVLDALDDVPTAYANGNFVADPNPVKRGPYADAQAAHPFVDSAFHRSSNLCGTCHNVSNPVFVVDSGIGDYVPQALDTPHPDGNPHNMAPVERTFSEWLLSEYATTGVYAPEFAGAKVDGIVSTCQDCHMSDTTGKGANGGPNRNDLAQHDMTGGNHFIPDIIPTFFGSEVDAGRLAAGKQRAIAMLQKAASLTLTPGQVGLQPTLTVRVTNETGHKLPTGYPEGRRVWVNVRGYDDQQNLVYESGAYNGSTGELTHDANLKIYETHPGLSPALATALGLPGGPSFHFALNDTVYFDNRVPPRGFVNAAFAAEGAAPVGQAYADGQYWDETLYTLPAGATSADVTLYYQSTSKEYVEFLRDENVTNNWGQDLHDAWVAQGRAFPVVMEQQSTSLPVDPTSVEPTPVLITAVQPSRPNPFNASTRIEYSLARPSHVGLRVYDVAGRLVRTLIDAQVGLGEHHVIWDGTDGRGHLAGSGVYIARFEADGLGRSIRMTLVK